MKRSLPYQEFGQLGIIESVSLRNFMCHDNLKFDFDPHMNFIIGRNGSGKSAVLTGIILALGGKSGATGRYTNIKGFIKTGKHSASVSVTLKNCGPEAYRPNEFGERITIERHFTSDGSSTYKLKSQSGQILSTLKEELTNILNTMDIQIENPITVLTQEISRNFLVSKNSKGRKLFQLFYRGTGLAKVEEDYNRANQQRKDADNEVAIKKAALPDMEKEIKTLKMLLDSTAKITDLKNELLWAMVIEMEKKRDQEMAAVDEIKKEEVILKKKLDSCRQDYNEVCQQLTQVQAQRKDCNDKMNNFRKSLRDENEKRMPLAQELREMVGTLSRYERETDRLSNEICSLEGMINEIKLKNQSDVNQDKVLHMTTINKLKEDISLLSQKTRELEQKKSTCLENHADLQKKVDQCQTEIQELEYKMRSITRDKQQLIEARRNKINVFGPEMQNVLRDIKAGMRSDLFKVEPKGPIGLYINVRIPEWSFVIQECLKLGFLRSFCCDNHSDADQLTKILNKYYTCEKSRPSIITSKFVNQVHDVQHYKTVSSHPTVLDMLNIKDPVITNCLIDQRQIENILLIADENEAINLMMHNPPQNCRSAYTRSGDQLYHTPYRNYAYRNKNQICILKTVNAEDIRKKDEEYNTIQVLATDKTAMKESLYRAIEKSSEEMRFVDVEYIKFRTKLRELQMKLRDEENNYEEPKDINCLHGDLDQLQREKVGLINKIATLKITFESKQKELTDLDQVTERLKNVLQVEQGNFHSLSAKVDEYENKKEALILTQKKIETQVNSLKPSIESAEKAFNNAVAVTERFIQNAETCSPRIDTNRSSATIREILNETENAIREQRNCDQETLANQYKEKVERLNKAKLELEKQEKINARIGMMMSKRFEEFQKICKNNVVSLTCCFTTLLKENDFTGYPDVNLEAETLEIYAKPKKMNNKSKEKQNLAQLSGGERSYVTIAFLLALWDRIHMPFRILDEYDVFMDPNNRHLSINLLINAAKANKNIQYIFLSPLELPPMEDTCDVKVHKMPAPKR